MRSHITLSKRRVGLQNDWGRKLSLPTPILWALPGSNR